MTCRGAQKTRHVPRRRCQGKCENTEGAVAPSVSELQLLDNANVLGFFALLARRRVELDSLAFFEALVTLALDIGEVYEDVFTLLTRDESETLFRIEKLNCALCHE